MLRANRIAGDDDWQRGFNANNAQAQLALADGAIVGTAIKAGGVVPGEPIDDYLVTQLLGAIRARS